MAGAAISWSEKTSVLESNQSPDSRGSTGRTGAQALGLGFHAEPCSEQPRALPLRLRREQSRHHPRGAAGTSRPPANLSSGGSGGSLNHP